MWPMLLNMTRDECRRTLRRLELEAYSNMISVFRAQGALEDNRKKLLEELRAVLHISSDRHSAEARRVSNDELLATIAEQLAGPNTGLGWISEGRRRIPLMPRGVPQTMYTEIADKAAEMAAAENKEIRKRLETEKLIAPKSNEVEMPDPESETAEGAPHSNQATNDTDLYPPIAMEDHTTQIWETELICRKRKIPEEGLIPDETSTPVKNIRNIPLTSNQKHLNLSQVYSRFSQPSASKSSGHSKHSYNQVSKVSTSKSSHPQTGRVPHKHRAHRQPKTHGKQKKNQDMSLSPQTDYSGPPGSFQASYAQSILGGKTKDHLNDTKGKQSGMAADSPATMPHELLGADSSHPDETSAYGPLHKHMATPKSSQLVVKKRLDSTGDKKVQMSEFKVLQKPLEEMKYVTSRQVSAALSSTPKPVGASGKLVTTKVISSLPKSRSSTAPVIQSDKMIVVSKSSIDNRLTNSKFIITSSGIVTTNKDSMQTSTNSISTKTPEALTPKGIPATDLKVSAKTFVLNPKSGQKMVVLPAKANKDVQLPLFHFKGIPTAMKLVSVSSHLNTQTAKSPAITVVSKPTVVNAIPSTAKIVGVEPIKTANMADIVPVKGLISPITSTKMNNPIVRPLNTKGNVIVVQKGATLGKSLTFAKNGNDVSKIIMGKNVNKLLQTSKTEQGDPTKSGNVIVLELNNEQTGRTTTMSKILGSRNNAPSTIQQEATVEETQEITQETPVLFDNQIAPEICNTNSLDSTTSLQDMERLEESSLGIIEKTDKEKADFLKDSDGGKDTSSVTDWEMELDTVSGKSKDDVDKLNSLHLDLGMSSDSEGEFMVGGCKAKDHLQCACDKPHSETPTGEVGEAGEAQDSGCSNDSEAAGGRVQAGTRGESEALSKARAKLSEKVAEARSQQKRIDVYSTALSAEINLDSFSYLDEGMMAGDEEPHPVSDTMPLHKNEQ